jgi:hypothetical protein
MSNIQKGYIVDGKVFANMTEVNEYLRGPKIREALSKLTKGNADLVDWLYENQSNINGAFASGTVRRVSKIEKKSLTKALEYIAETLKNDSKAAFVVQNWTTIADTFKWPTQKRIADEDKEAAIVEAVSELTDDNADLSKWIIANKDALFAAFEAGVEKREASPEMLARLAAGREKAAALRAAKSATK